MSRRLDRVNDLLREVIAEILARDLKDPRLRVDLISVTEVDTAPDLRSARVRVSILGPEDARAEALRALAHSHAYIRRLMRPRLVLRHLPDLQFEYDDRIAEGRRISDLIDGLHGAPDAPAAASGAPATAEPPP